MSVETSKFKYFALCIFHTSLANTGYFLKLIFNWLQKGDREMSLNFLKITNGGYMYVLILWLKLRMKLVEMFTCIEISMISNIVTILGYGIYFMQKIRQATMYSSNISATILRHINI